MIAADKRLAELRRVIDQVAAEATAQEASAEASDKHASHLDQRIEGL